MNAERARVGRALAFARIDWAPTPRQPTAVRVVMATTLAIAVALLADAALVAAGTVLFPTTAGYEHFRFEDYAKLTVIGVLFGCAGWPILTRITSSPRWLYLRLTLLASLALLLPDAWLLMRGQPFRAVAVLVAMHVAVAVITYNLIVRLAPARNRDPAG